LTTVVVGDEEKAGLTGQADQEGERKRNRCLRIENARSFAAG
jgi:hypothetical protein